MTQKSVAPRDSRAGARAGEALTSQGVWRCFGSELFGTLLLTFAAIVPVVLDASPIEKAVSPGLLIMVMIYALGNISGAHFNPIVTLAFALRQAFNWDKVPLYWTAQMLGGIVAALLVRVVVGDQHNLGATTPSGSPLQSVVVEAILSLILVFVILATAKQHKIAGNNAAVAVGSTIALCGFIGAKISGASMNPARSFGPALFGGAFNSYWIYLIGPIIGSALGALLFTMLQGLPNAEERRTAEGSEGEPDG